MTEALVDPNKEGYVKLLIENHESHPVFLEPGTMLDQLQAVQIINNDKVLEVLHLQVKDPNVVKETMPEPPSTPTERSQQLLDRLKVTWDAISVEEGLKLKSLIDEYTDVFAINPMEVDRTDLVQHKIDTGGQAPLRQPPRRIPFSSRAKVEKMVQEMLDTGIIEHSSSPWASPIVLVSKQDGSTRFCMDYRRLNAITKLDGFPLPRVDDSLDLLAGMKYFTTLDLATGYWQVGMAPEAQEKTAFVTHEGLYEFSVMPFGFCNAPATFQLLMEITLQGLVRHKCVVYLDDIMVIGRTFEDHLNNLREVLKPKKCHLVQSEVTYLGYVVSESGISADASKVKAVRDFPAPKNLKQLRSFLGLASYYRRFIPRFSQVAAPLFGLTRKDTPYQWSESCQETFEKLKKMLTEAPVLAFPDFKHDFILETDASGTGLGAVLSQKQEDGTTRPICFASRTLQTHEAYYGVSELEALAVVWAVKHFRVYLYGHTCDVYTDHEAFLSLLNTPHPSGRLARWGLALQELNLNIHYCPGRLNKSADSLSRSPVSTEDDVSAGEVAQLQPDDLGWLSRRKHPQRTGREHY